MNTKSEAAVKGIKDLGSEVSAWENRLLFLQNECENLRRKSEQTKKEIESALAIAQAELDKKREQARTEMGKVNDATARFEADKVEFQGILSEFNKEKRAFDAERSKMMDHDSDTKKLN